MSIFRTSSLVACLLAGLVALSACQNPVATATTVSPSGGSSPAASSSKSVTALVATFTTTGQSVTVVTSLVATFTTTGESVTAGGTAQVSGTTANDFTNPVTYTVTAQDGSTQSYTVTVNVASLKWTASNALRGGYWVSMAASSDGKVVIGASQYNSSNLSAPYGVYVSTDSGVDWTSVGPSSFATSLVSGVAISSDGTYMAVVVDGGNIWVSSNSGANWTDETKGLSESGAKWFDVACSSSGQYMAAVVNGGDIWTSNDHGSTWKDQTGSGSEAWGSIASSASGQYLAASISSKGYIYTSSDYGVQWTKQTNSGSRGWTSIASSSNGSRLIASNGYGYLFESTDYGLDWSKISGPPKTVWVAVASSSDGRILMGVTGSGDGVYTSADYGATWQKSTDGYWGAGTVSSDGKLFFVGGLSGGAVEYGQ